jgi:hypothetical protein
LALTQGLAEWQYPFSATICRWPPPLWTNQACYFVGH